MPFVLNDYQRIQEYLNLSPEVLLSGSWLRVKGQYLEQLDSQAGTNKVLTVQGYLDELDTLKATIDAKLGDVAYSAETVSVSGEYAVTYAQSGSQNDGLYHKRVNLILAIARDLQIQPPSNSGRLLRS